MSSNSKSDKTPLAILLDWEEILTAGLKSVWERSKSRAPPGQNEEYIGVFLQAASEEMVNQLIASDEFEIVFGPGNPGYIDTPLVQRKS